MYLLSVCTGCLFVLLCSINQFIAYKATFGILVWQVFEVIRKEEESKNKKHNKKLSKYDGPQYSS